MKCYECDGETKPVIMDYEFSESGLKNVTLIGWTVDVCQKCGAEYPQISRLPELLQVIAEGIIQKKGLLTGNEIRFLRKELEMRGKDFAKVLGVDEITLSRWETGVEQVGPQSDHLIRLLYAAKRFGEFIKDHDVIDWLESIRPEPEEREFKVEQTEDVYQLA